MSTGFIKSRTWNIARIMADVARHNQPSVSDPKVLYVSYWRGKAYGGFSGQKCRKCHSDLKRYPVYDGPRSLCASCMEKDGNYAKKTG